MEQIDLDLDEPQTIDFKVRVEGSNASSASARLVCECGDVSYVFKGHRAEEDDVVRFEIPKMCGRVKEGLHECKVEVFVENRYFVPATFTANFKRAVSVVVEAVKHEKTRVMVTAEAMKKKLVVLDKKLLRQV